MEADRQAARICVGVVIGEHRKSGGIREGRRAAALEAAFAGARRRMVNQRARAENCVAGHPSLAPVLVTATARGSLEGRRGHSVATGSEANAVGYRRGWLDVLWARGTRWSFSEPSLQEIADQHRGMLRLARRSVPPLDGGRRFRAPPARHPAPSSAPPPASADWRWLRKSRNAPCNSRTILPCRNSRHRDPPPSPRECG